MGVFEQYQALVMFRFNLTYEESLSLIYSNPEFSINLLMKVFTRVDEQ